MDRAVAARHRRPRALRAFPGDRLLGARRSSHGVRAGGSSPGAGRAPVPGRGSGLSRPVLRAESRGVALGVPARPRLQAPERGLAPRRRGEPSLLLPRHRLALGSARRSSRPGDHDLGVPPSARGRLWDRVRVALGPGGRPDRKRGNPARESDARDDRLLAASAAVKLRSGAPSGRNPPALGSHYETQPLPTWIGWSVHRLPLWFHRLSAGVTFAVEGLVPFLLFAPRRVRFTAAAVILAHQLLIAATGNYGFFNLLTIVLCIPLLDDAVWPAALRAARERFVDETPAPRAAGPASIRGAVLTVLFLLSLVPLANAMRGPRSWLGPLASAYELAAPLRIVDYYGLFAIMTKERPEIRIEGSNDGVAWKGYEFRYKPG